MIRGSKRMASRTLFMTFCSFIFVIACGVGLVMQMLSMSQLYFSYKISTSIKIGIPGVISSDATSLCASYLDILDYEALNRKTGRNWSYAPDYEKLHKYQDELYISEIFEFTPHEQEIMAEISFRDHHSFTILNATGSDCYLHFNVSKYIYLEQMCYRISPLASSPMPFNFYAVTPSSPGFIYMIILKNSTMAMSSTVRIVNHKVDFYPFRSLRASPIIVRRIDDAFKKVEYNLFISNQVRLSTKLLPSPYETNCFDYSIIGMENEVDCRQRCVNQMVHQEFNKIPFSAIIKEASRHQIVSYYDVMNRTFARRLLQIGKECRFDCKRRNCIIHVAISDTVASPDPRFTLVLTVPSHPSFTTTSSAKMDLVEFLTYIMSTLGIWSGLNMMAFEPFKVVRFLRSKVKHASKRGNNKTIRRQEREGNAGQKSRTDLS